ncbi:exodeoxyribonuclease V subunit gamma [Ramlibacter solisilvae]|uniref:RecBCD enzyme subunit RecC n=1 Tax=Ramlibacter tataouinensis TaxID=94132 RepID=A0A127JWT4_9BURK|nr:exodeoxyribonuclease V subunit gamma [Ramlibacter tataouinensis]AMO24365.1 exodeoxyribonuclease V subunit gamma [Ramlibacter tataouinensis]
MALTSESLTPGFMVVHGNHPEALCELMVAWMKAHPLAPLEDEVVLVQSSGIAQWLKLALAADVTAGGAGVAAAVRTRLPAQALWDVYRAVLGREQVPPQSPFDKSQLPWWLMRLLPGLLAQPEFEPLRRFLDSDEDGRKKYQLAVRLADLLDQYQVYRADWLARWAQGEDVLALAGDERIALPEAMRWQPLLWRALLQDAKQEGKLAASRAQVHEDFLQAVGRWQGQAPAGLPRRVTVFGVSSLPAQTLEALAAVSRWSQVLLCVHNPCRHDWSHIVAERDVQRARRQQRRPGLARAGDDALHLDTHPLLAAWGRQGRDFVRLLDEYDRRDAYEAQFQAIDQRIDLFSSNPGDSLLRQLQDDILELRPLAETQSQWPPVAPHDSSIAFHIAHGPQREVEVLHDQLLKAFSEDPTLQPRDVIVMVPDITDYAAHIQAVFGPVEPGDARYLPFYIADQGQRQRDPLLGAIEQLLSLPESRLGASSVLDLLHVPALRARFGIDEDQLPLVRQWVDGANIRWGLHASHRGALDLPERIEGNSWAFGLRRMLLGYAVGEGEHWNGIEPMVDVGGLEAALLGPLVRLADALEKHWGELREPGAPEQWAQRLQQLLDDFFEAADGTADGLTLLRARAALQEWRQACEDAQLSEPLTLAVVRDHWLGRLEPQGLRQPFFAGGVTFASLMPMRAIPFRWVALLGMNDGDYPRSRPPMDFDLMARDHRPGDRSRREDDRYLFLEALLSARDHLHLSWVGRSIQDNELRPASVLVAQLRDHLAAGWRLQGDPGQDLLAALTVEHRLQPFHPAYFDGSSPRLFSYAGEWRRSLAAGELPPAAPGVLAPPANGRAITLKQLGDFLKNPARAFLRQRLRIHFGDDDPVTRDEEPFDLDGLENWQLQDELIRAQKAAVDTGGGREEALAAALARITRRGDLPHGAFGAQVLAQLEEPMPKLFEAYVEQLQRWPQVLADEPLEWSAAGDDPLQLHDWLTGLRTNEAGERCRLVLASTGIVSGRNQAWRLEQLLPHWAAHLAGHLGGAGMTTVILSKAGQALLPPLPPESVQAWWAALLQAWDEGMRRPLPFAPQPAMAWLKADAADAAQEAEKAHAEELKRDLSFARAYPDFDALWDEGAFVTWIDRLLRPLRDQLRTPGPQGEGGS